MVLRRAVLGVVVALVAIGGLTSRAGAQDDGPVIAGTWIVTVKITSQDLPGDFRQKDGDRTYYFGEGCGAEDCKIIRTTGEGEKVGQGVTKTAGGWTWTGTSALDCFDDVTGELSTPHGADFTTTFTFSPTDTVERDGTTYVSKMEGTTLTELELTPAGVADKCKLGGQPISRAQAVGTLEAHPVAVDTMLKDWKPSPLASALDPKTGLPTNGSTPGSSGSGGSGGSGASTQTGTMPGFTLPLTTYQAKSRLAVARGSRSQVPASVVLPGESVDGSRFWQNVVLAALLGLLMVFPSELFNKTYDENHERIDKVVVKAFPKRKAARAAAVLAEAAAAAPPGGSPSLIDVGPDGAPPLAEPLPPAPPVAANGDAPPLGGAAPLETPVLSSIADAPDAPDAPTSTREGRGKRVVLFAGVTFAGAVIAGFLDPKFGFNRAAELMFIGVFVSMLFGMLVSVLTGRTFRSAIHHDRSWLLVAVPSGLVIAAVCVLVSRLVSFAPGYLYGLVGGASFAVAMTPRNKGRAASLGIVVGLVVAFVAWLVYSPIAHAANDVNPAMGILVLDSLLAGLFIGGIEGMLFGLVPLKFMPGYTIKQWSWWAWIPLTAIVTVTFVNVLLRPASGYLGKSTGVSVAVTFALFVAFGIFSIAFWSYFRLRPTAPGEAPPPTPPAEPVAEDLVGQGAPS